MPNVRFERVAHATIRRPRQYTLNIVGIPPLVGTAREWWTDFLALIALAVLLGLVTFIMAMWV
tara:strand:+ start:697 stop:885 length:189 start_codon:yes stop_codon:yes gene_type:complete